MLYIVCYCKYGSLHTLCIFFCGLITFTDNSFLHIWHLITISAFLSLLFDNFAIDNSLVESQILLLHIGQGYFFINSPLIML